MISNTISAVSVVILISIFLVFPRTKRRSLYSIQGPPSKSWLWGNVLDINYQENVGDLIFKWMREYGTAWLVKGCFGGETLIVTDPQAIQHICQKSGYDYITRHDMRIIARMVTGRGLVWAHGDVHKRQRRIMEPAFSVSQLRSYIFPFYTISSKLVGKWRESLTESGSTSQDITVNKWLAKTTLDIIGQAAFAYDFGALDNEKNEVAQAYDNMFIDSSLYPSKFGILFKEMLNYIPPFLLDYVEYLPSREFARFRHTSHVFGKCSRQLIAQKKQDSSVIEGGNPRDTMSILVRANASENPRHRMSDEEMIAQMFTFTLAGHETTATTMSFLLWELAKAPEYQHLMREEVLAAHEKLNEGSQFSLEELDGMTYTIAAIKETLRLHPIIHQLHRTAVKDDTIPLSKPITTTDSQVLSAIPISAGQDITVSISGYNRYMGDDADSWNPHRFLDLNAGRRDTKTGLYANLMTFAAGVHGCIGWRFAIIELQVIAVQLVENFEFSLPDKRPEIMRVPAPLMTPMVRDEMELGSALPLLVSLVPSHLTSRIASYKSALFELYSRTPITVLAFRLQLNRQENVGDLTFKWMRAYGSVWRIKGCFGEDVLMVRDPHALQHIFQKSGYQYPKRQDVHILARILMGKGLVWARDIDHQRQRKIIDPAFTVAQIRSYLLLFHQNTSKLVHKWTEVLTKSDGSKEILVNKWLAKTTLDIIGQTAFDYDFGALDNEKNEVAEAYDSMFLDSLLYQSKFDILFKAMWNHVPEFFLHYVEYFPTREYARFRHTLRVLGQCSEQLIAQKKQDPSVMEGGKPHDALSIFVKANASEDPRYRLGDEEMIAEMFTLTLAGHETTSTAMSFFLWELAKAPDYQRMMREEIQATRQRQREDAELSLDELDGMTYTVAAVKETLRLHPIIHELFRTASKDDVLPLSNPITTTSGLIISGIPVSAGQTIMISISGYNRLPDIWGDDADCWNPRRFLDTNAKRDTKTGVYASLMTFSSGVQACIGWRFAVAEMQAIVTKLVEHFEFSLPDRQPEILRVASTLLMTPMVRGEKELGTALPLRVTLVESQSA